MKISKRTINIMKNFATVNQSISVRAGSKVRTISNVMDIYATSLVDETFPKDFAIYDLNEFLTIVGLFDDPDFDFKDDYVLIREGASQQKYYYADAAIIKSPPTKGVSLPSVEVNASITKERLSGVLKAINANGAPDLTFENGSLIIHDKAIPNHNQFIIEDVAEKIQGHYSFTVNVNKLKLMPDDYNIEICVRGLIHFSGSNDVDYYIALQPDSEFAIEAGGEGEQPQAEVV